MSERSYIAKFKVPVRVYLNLAQFEEARALINLMWLGREAFESLEERPDPAHAEAHWNLRKSYEFQVEVGVLPDGTIELIK